MPEEFKISAEAENLIREIITKNNIKEISDIKYQSGSQVGDGYISKTIAVDIINGKKSFKIFLKCALNIKNSETMPIDKLYGNEIYFYDVVLPELARFVKERGFEDCLRIIPICYGTASENIVALENLREKKFTLFDRTKLMNDVHIVMVLKAFARFHAVSFAFKDQRREVYDRLVENAFDFYSSTNDTFKSYMAKIFDEFVVEKIDGEKEKYLLEKCGNLGEWLISAMGGAKENINQYSILTQGDCHCMNMMFAYENENKENPSDIRLIDWQLIREASPVYDLAYFFYPVASEEALDKLHNYLKIYHEELSKWIRRLGSDPDVLYPYDVLVNEWKEWGSKYGFAISFNIIRAMLSNKEEVFNMEEHDFDDKEAMENLELPKLAKEQEYDRRLKSILVHMVKNEFL